MKETKISKFIPVHCSKIWYLEQHTEVEHVECRWSHV